MILRLATMGILVCASTLAGLSVPLLSTDDDTDVNPNSVVSRTFRSDFIPVPYINFDGVQGYFIGRFNVHYESSAGLISSDLIKMQLHHITSQYFYENGRKTFWLGGSFTPEDIAQMLGGELSAQFSEATIKKLEIRQIDYLLVDEVRRPVIEF